MVLWVDCIAVESCVARLEYYFHPTRLANLFGCVPHGGAGILLLLLLPKCTSSPAICGVTHARCGSHEASDRPYSEHRGPNSCQVCGRVQGEYRIPLLGVQGKEGGCDCCSFLTWPPVLFSRLSQQMLFTEQRLISYQDPEECQNFAQKNGGPQRWLLLADSCFRREWLLYKVFHAYSPSCYIPIIFFYHGHPYVSCALCQYPCFVSESPLPNVCADRSQSLCISRGRLLRNSRRSSPLQSLLLSPRSTVCVILFFCVQSVHVLADGT